MNDAPQTTPEIVERTRCLAIIENSINGHRISLRWQYLSESDRGRHLSAIAALETVAERIAES